ncbi:MAG: metallophosphoesterase family protein [Xanthobacteraceae bacterium]
MTFRIAQISDTHLSGEKPFFIPNFERVAELLRAEKYDLVVNTGDVSLNGTDNIDDLVAAKKLHDAIGLDYRVIAGNHDIGDNQECAQAHGVTDERRNRFLSVFGDDWWTHDVPGWRVIGLNALVMAGAMEASNAQFAFLADAAAGSSNRSILLFIHKPLYLASRHEQDVGGRYVNPAARARLFSALGQRQPKIVASGHVHQSRDAVLEGIHHYWAPATAFVVPASHQVTVGERFVGFVEHSLLGDGSYQSRVVPTPGLVCHSIADFPDAYGEIDDMMPRVSPAE